VLGPWCQAQPVHAKQQPLFEPLNVQGRTVNPRKENVHVNQQRRLKRKTAMRMGKRLDSARAHAGSVATRVGTANAAE